MNKKNYAFDIYEMYAIREALIERHHHLKNLTAKSPMFKEIKKKTEILKNIFITDCANFKNN
jgi:hypothetical protein